MSEEKQKQALPEPVKAHLLKTRAVTENTDAAKELFNTGRYGILLSSGKVQLSLIEAIYLSEKQKIILLDQRNKEITFENCLKKSQKQEHNFWAKYCVYKDIRNRGYIIKTALKFGADFRVYDRGIKPGEDHAKWVVFPVLEGSTLTWHDFSAKNRVAHSTKKRLLIGIIDDENDVTYYQISWIRP
ncbi:tRNA-intron lyase [Candidatus Woesearchaeota archaeon]|nr:tRNA-intron lyase [Candidatus Woesearchaeota archaeon]